MYRYPSPPSVCFAVVRNPYDRIISAYNFKYKGCKSCVHFQQWLTSKLLNLRNSLKDIHMHINEYKHNLDIHLLPQHLFTHDSKFNSVVDNILRFETLKTDFEALMQKCNSNIVLDIHIGKPLPTVTYCTKEWLSAENVLLINNIYRHDFELFKYPFM